MAQARKTQRRWTREEWRLKVQDIADMDWGALQHGGFRKARTSAVVEPSRGIDREESVGDKASPSEEFTGIVDGPAAVGARDELSGGDRAVGIAPSPVGDDQQHEGQTLHVLMAPTVQQPLARDMSLQKVLVWALCQLH